MIEMIWDKLLHSAGMYNKYATNDKEMMDKSYLEYCHGHEDGRIAALSWVIEEILGLPFKVELDEISGAVNEMEIKGMYYKDFVSPSDRLRLGKPRKLGDWGDIDDNTTSYRFN